MSSLIRRFARNTAGRDLVIGDIHGHFTKARAALNTVGFDPEAGDRLFSVGDLVDRGPESADVLDWLDQPWFHAVQGNHEDMAADWGWPGYEMDAECYVQNGGAWNVANTPLERLRFADALGTLPLAIEVETEAGLVGIVHADCPYPSWHEFAGALVAAKWADPAMQTAIREYALWSRERIETGNESGVAGIKALMVGHTPRNAVTVLGNVHYLDTYGWHRAGSFSIYDLATLQPAQPAHPRKIGGPE